eukprot:5184741-Pyramimonas_sp.AAC.1
MERYQELYGAREPSDGMEASIHAHFYEQIRPLGLSMQCRGMNGQQILRARECELINGSCSK